MNEFNEIDRALAEAFTERPSTLSRPSLRDVRQRARRHQRQRKAGVVGACAVVGVGGAAVLATRSPNNQTTLGYGATESTICFPTASTIVYDDSIPDTHLDTTTSTYNGEVFYYTVQPGDNPTSVANSFGVTLSEMDAANVNTPGYGLFQVGLELAIPFPGPSTEPTAWTTTTISEGIQTVYIVQRGDTPEAVANVFGVTLAQLDVANLDRPGYVEWLEGTSILIPLSDAPPTTEPLSATTTLAPLPPLPLIYTDCFPVGEPTTSTPEATVTTVVGETSSTTTSTIPNFTKIGTAIQVINCSNQEGVAGFLTDALAAEGFTMLEADTGTIDLPVTKVLYNPDDPFAFQVALTLSIFLGNAVVEPSGPVLPTATLGTWAPGSSVIVLLGDDLAGKSLAQIAYPDSAAVPTSSTVV